VKLYGNKTIGTVRVTEDDHLDEVIRNDIFGDSQGTDCAACT